MTNTQLSTPFLMMDMSTVTSKYGELRRALPEALIYYAVKANPMPAVIRRLADIGSRFDVASREELQQCLALGIPPDRISFGSTIKKASAILISRKSEIDARRWVYIDCGKFGGLAETMDEAIKYPILAPGKSRNLAPVILAGPTCDSADILYEKTLYELPIDLREGDRIQILSAGAYTHSYSSAGFNGFAPLQTVSVQDASARSGTRVPSYSPSLTNGGEPPSGRQSASHPSLGRNSTIA